MGAAGLPANLAVFDEALWSGRDEAERYGAWMDARRRWADAHDLIELPGDAEAWAAFPDGVFRAEEI